MRDADVFRQAADWLAGQRAVWLCTVLETWGSSPRPCGSVMVCNALGQTVGSLSGGCVEEELVARMVAGDFAEPVTRLRYGATAEEAERLRLPCGGSLVIAIEHIQPAAATRDVVTSIADALRRRQRVLWQRDYPAGFFTLDAVPAGHAPVVVHDDQHGNIACIRQCLGPPFRLLLIGVSEVSRAVAQLALWLDYDVLVCEPRRDARERWDVTGVSVLAQLPDDAVRAYADDSACAILALTHDPRIDDMGLMEAFATRAAYIGAMGSLRTSQKRRERLQELGVTAEQLQRLHAPVGMDTGSKTPMEIAVSIMAQLTAVRAGKPA